MDKPRLEDFGLDGIDSRPRPDYDKFPMSDDEYERGLRAAIEWCVGNERVSKFRHALNLWKAELSDEEWERYRNE